MMMLHQMWDFNNINPDPLLGQRIRRIEILAHVLMFQLFSHPHEVNFMDQYLHCSWCYRSIQRGMGGRGGWEYVLKQNPLNFKVKIFLIVCYSTKNRFILSVVRMQTFCLLIKLYLKRRPPFCPPWEFHPHFFKMYVVC